MTEDKKGENMDERLAQLNRPVSEEEKRAASRKWTFDASGGRADLVVQDRGVLVDGRVRLADDVRLVNIERSKATISVGREDGIRIEMVLIPERNFLIVEAESFVRGLRGFFSSIGRRAN